MAKKIPGKRPKDKIVEDQLALFKAQTEVRYKAARKAYDAQDTATRRAIDIMIERMGPFKVGAIKMFPNGKKGGAVIVPIPTDYQEQNVLFIVMEIVRDFALMGIRLANYEFPKGRCAECGEKVKR